jgi:hypothetical protein
VTLARFLGATPAPETLLSQSGNAALLAQINNLAPAFASATAGASGAPPTPYDAPNLTPKQTEHRGCAGCAVAPAERVGGGSVAGLLVFSLAALRRKKRW